MAAESVAANIFLFGVIKKVSASTNDPVTFWGQNLCHTNKKVTVTFWIIK